MRRSILFTLMSTACAVAAAATVYKWVDENGVTHYSDQPHENAEKVHLAAPQTYTAPKVAAQPAKPAPPPAAAPNTYQSCVLLTPADQQNLPNTDAVPTLVQINPAPHDGDVAVLLYDGAALPNYPPAGGGYTIQGVDRGAHSLQLLVQDAGGHVLCQSASVTFTVTQPSVLNPNNPNFRH